MNLQSKSRDEKTKDVTVSIIIATYKRDAELKRALESVVKQTYNLIEIIVISDNADTTWNQRVQNIVNEMSFIRPIIYIQNQTNRGSAETRNIGIKEASGEYITFLDDDDIYLPKKIKNQLNHMLVEDSDYSITDLHLYDENNKLIERRNRKYIKKNTKEDLLKYHFMYHMTGTDTMMFRKNYLLDIGGFSPINVGDEFYLMKKAIEAGGKFSYLPICDIKAFVHTNTDGLSSGESKVNGENELYRYKKRYFHMLSAQDIRYIKMRHYAVLAFAEIRRKNYGYFVRYAASSFFSSPINCARLFIQRT